jgi:hypothetical protein
MNFYMEGEEPTTTPETPETPAESPTEEAAK